VGFAMLIDSQANLDCFKRSSVSLPSKYI
jgi:hypothetical protein